INVAAPACDLSRKIVRPPTPLLNVAPLLLIVALPALESTSNSVKPPNAPLTVVPPLLLMVALPAFEEPVNFVSPRPLAPEPALDPEPALLLIVALSALEV